MNMRSLEAVEASNRLELGQMEAVGVARRTDEKKLSKLSKNCSSPNRGGAVHIVDRAGRSSPNRVGSLANLP